MVLQLKNNYIEKLDKFSKIPLYYKALLEKDPKRFTGLGDKNTKAFIRHACEYAYTASLSTTRDVFYLMHVMSILGSYFYEDPRYEGLHQIYMTFDGDEEISKTNRVHEKFKKFVNRHIGENGQIISNRINPIRELLSKNITSLEDVFKEFYLIVEIEEKHLKSLYFEDFEKNSQRASQDLNINTLRGQQLCLGISLVSGFGFYKDPLCPWVRDISAKPEYKTEDQRIDAIRDFIDLRLRIHHERLEKLNER